MDEHGSYRSPLESRYASLAMRAIWSDQRKFGTWRRLWLALAEAEHELGLSVTAEQVADLRAHLDDINYEAAAKYEKQFRHDVMAHIHALGDVAPKARPIIHLGATSQFVVCNTELLQLRDAMQLIAAKLARVIDALGTFAEKYKTLPTLGFTHYQPAQPTTVGKRATLWAQDFAIALEDVEHRIDTLRFRGVKGTTGTQASFMALFNNDEAKVERLDELVTAKMDWPRDRRFIVTGQTYPRLVDAQILSTLAIAAAAVHKCATDLRLLANRREVEEPFESTQIGSSAMAYKRNPMRCERACAVARFVMNLPGNALQTAAVQWFERTLDDSANRRIVLPEAFLALDGVLDIMHNVSSGLIVNERIIAANLLAELPFMATEDILMAAVQNGADRQAAHEIVRKHSHEAAAHMKQTGGANDLLDRLQREKMFAKINFSDVLDPARYIGRAPSQVDSFIERVVQTIRRRYADSLQASTDLRV